MPEGYIPDEPKLADVVRVDRGLSVEFNTEYWRATRASEGLVWSRFATSGSAIEDDGDMQGWRWEQLWYRATHSLSLAVLSPAMTYRMHHTWHVTP